MVSSIVALLVSVALAPAASAEERVPCGDGSDARSEGGAVGPSAAFSAQDVAVSSAGPTSAAPNADGPSSTAPSADGPSSTVAPARDVAAAATEPGSATALARTAAPALAGVARDPLADERAFSREIQRFARLWAFTKRLVSAREARAFEEAEERYQKLSALTRELADKEAQASEREFEGAVTLYLRKRELTRELTLAQARGAAAAPAASEIAPSRPAPTR